jgi:pimeloyl-ACP methyl ester carboxylesterase
VNTATALLSTGVRLHYYDAGEGDEVIVLLHGWPQTGWQWRHVMPLFVERGYRVIAPDVRGAGHSSRPRADPGMPADTRGMIDPAGGYAKWTLAGDIHELLTQQLGLSHPAVVVGHDIGAMIAVAYALRYRGAARALVYGESPLPGTEVYEQVKTMMPVFHFAFHAVLDLPEMLVTGREQVYIQHFVDRLGYRPEAVDTEHYARAYSQPGALRAGFDLYRAFEQDARDVRHALADGGKLTIPILGLYGQISRFAEVTEAMGREIAENVTTAQVPQTGHWLAEENPAALADLVHDFANQ